MFVRNQDGNRYINLDRVDFIEVNSTYNSVTCKINGIGHTLGKYDSKEDAQKAIDELLIKSYGKMSRLYEVQL